MQSIKGLTMLIAIMAAGLIFTPLFTVRVLSAPALQEMGEEIEIADLMSRPDLYIDQVVSVNGIVTRTFDAVPEGAHNAFSIADAEATELLIISPIDDNGDPAVDMEMVGEEVMVTGLVRFVSWADATADYEVNLPDELEEDFSAEPVLIAESVQALTDEAVAPDVEPTPDVEPVATPSPTQVSVPAGAAPDAPAPAAPDAPLPATGGSQSNSGILLVIVALLLLIFGGGLVLHSRRSS